MRIARHPNGPRLYCASLRIHHGLTGAVLCALALLRRHPLVFGIGAVLVADDAHDFPWRLRDV